MAGRVPLTAPERAEIREDAEFFEDFDPSPWSLGPRQVLALLDELDRLRGVVARVEGEVERMGALPRLHTDILTEGYEQGRADTCFVVKAALAAGTPEQREDGR